MQFSERSRLNHGTYKVGMEYDDSLRIHFAGVSEWTYEPVRVLDYE